MNGRGQKTEMPDLVYYRMDQVWISFDKTNYDTGQVTKSKFSKSLKMVT